MRIVSAQVGSTMGATIYYAKHPSPSQAIDVVSILAKLPKARLVELKSAVHIVRDFIAYPLAASCSSASLLRILLSYANMNHVHGVAASQDGDGNPRQEGIHSQVMALSWVTCVMQSASTNRDLLQADRNDRYPLNSRHKIEEMPVFGGAPIHADAFHVVLYELLKLAQVRTCTYPCFKGRKGI